MFFVLHMMHKMISSARDEAGSNEHAKAWCVRMHWVTSLM